MKKRHIIILTIIAVLIISGYLIWGFSHLSTYAGKYISVDADDSTYELTLTKTGHISITDIGAGNPALEGFVYIVPDANNNFRIRTFGETDKTFLGLGENKLNIWLITIGRLAIDEESPATYKAIVLEAADSMQFNSEEAAHN